MHLELEYQIRDYLEVVLIDPDQRNVEAVSSKSMHYREIRAPPDSRDGMSSHMRD